MIEVRELVKVFDTRGQIVRLESTPFAEENEALPNDRCTVEVLRLRPGEASLNALRSTRQGLPLWARVITVSSLLAAISFLASACGISCSRVPSHSVPSHEPCAPRASEAATCAPVPMPPAAMTGRPSAAATICGTSVKVPTGPVWPPAS